MDGTDHLQVSLYTVPYNTSELANLQKGQRGLLNTQDDAMNKGLG